MQPEDMRHIAVIGAGTMGAGIAGEFARAGCQVMLADTSDTRLEQGRARLTAAQNSLVEADLLTDAEANAAVDRVRTTLSLEIACADADLVVESISEELQSKQELFSRLHGISPSHAVFASNTSGLSITRIAAACGRPEQVAGMHFWNPPHVIPLVEVARGQETREDTAALLLDLARRLGKRPILVRRDVPGFVGNRLQFAVFREALHILAEGIASAEDIDTAMTAGPGLRYGLLGPLRTADLGGLDVFAAISQYLFEDLSVAREPATVLKELVSAGRLGAKTGAGFYDYTAEERDRLVQRRDKLLLHILSVSSRS